MILLAAYLLGFGFAGLARIGRIGGGIVYLTVVDCSRSGSSSRLSSRKKESASDASSSSGCGVATTCNSAACASSVKGPTGAGERDVVGTCN
jgi:hypothetical protein